MQEVIGSIPFSSTKSKSLLWGYSSVGRASALQAEGQRFDPVYLHHLVEVFKTPRGGIAQLGEHLLCKQRVNGSIPFTSTILNDVKRSPWGYSSVGRASALQAEGQRFDPVYLHHLKNAINHKSLK